MDVPPVYRDLVRRHGDPLGVETARGRWAALVAAAEAGTVTLITREGWTWAALVPLAEVAAPVADLPVWSLSAARARLGDLVRETEDGPQVLTRHHRPVAALIAAGRLADRPAERLDADRLLREGHRIVLAFDPGQEGVVDGDGFVLDGPVPETYTATAVDHDGRTVAEGVGDTLAEALLCLAAYLPPAARWADKPPF